MNAATADRSAFMRPLTLSLDEAEALPDPDDCQVPGTKWGRITNTTQCRCVRHTEVQRWARRASDHRRYGTPADGAGTGWYVGVNALEFGPLHRHLVLAGLLTRSGKVVADHAAADPPHRDVLDLAARCFLRGWATLHETDRICIRLLELHPALVYGTDWDALSTGESL